ncbi:hypothetical protein AB1Y20_017615 [Prymnesium parvum]|uniref:Uncharacterized protein n=1 Tax=Prymnesium parvum TaxID=97485 RepID=A0AB34JL17_PRYPA
MLCSPTMASFSIDLSVPALSACTAERAKSEGAEEGAVGRTSQSSMETADWPGCSTHGRLCTHKFANDEDCHFAMTAHLVPAKHATNREEARGTAALEVQMAETEEEGGTLGAAQTEREKVVDAMEDVMVVLKEVDMEDLAVGKV